MSAESQTISPAACLTVPKDTPGATAIPPEEQRGTVEAVNEYDLMEVDPPSYRMTTNEPAESAKAPGPNKTYTDGSGEAESHAAQGTETTGVADARAAADDSSTLAEVLSTCRRLKLGIDYMATVGDDRQVLVEGTSVSVIPARGVSTVSLSIIPERLVTSVMSVHLTEDESATYVMGNCDGRDMRLYLVNDTQWPSGAVVGTKDVVRPRQEAAIHSAIQDGIARWADDTEEVTTSAVFLPDDNDEHRLRVVAEADLVEALKATAVHKAYADALELASKSKYFTRLNIRNDSDSAEQREWFVKMETATERPLVADTTLGRRIEFIRVPSALQDSPATQARIIQTRGLDPLIENGTLDSNSAVANHEGILVHGDDLDNLKMSASLVHAQLRSVDLIVDMDKSQFTVEHTEFWGFGLGGGRLDPIRNYSAITNWVMPTTKESREDLTSLSYTILVNSDSSLSYGPTDEPWTKDFFEEVRDECCETLRKSAHVPRDEDIVLYTSASGATMGSVLMSESGFVVSVLSEPMGDLCANFSDRQKQFWAAFKAAIEWQRYIQDRDHEAEVVWIPDDQSITQLDLDGSDSDSLVNFLKGKLQSYNLKVKPLLDGEVNPATYATPKPVAPLTVHPMEHAGVLPDTDFKESGPDESADVSPTRFTGTLEELLALLGTPAAADSVMAKLARDGPKFSELLATLGRRSTLHREDEFSEKYRLVELNEDEKESVVPHSDAIPEEEEEEEEEGGDEKGKGEPTEKSLEAVTANSPPQPPDMPADLSDGQEPNSGPTGGEHAVVAKDGSQPVSVADDTLQAEE